MYFVEVNAQLMDASRFEAKLCPQLLVALVIGLSTFSGGILEGYTSPAIPQLLVHSTEIYVTGETTLDIPNVTTTTTTTLSTVATEPLPPVREESSTENEGSDVTTVIAVQTASTNDEDDNATATEVDRNVTRVKRKANGTDVNDNDDADIHITEEQASWLGSLLLLGCFVGAVCSSWAVTMGRRRSILASALPRITGWILIAAAPNINYMYAGRFLTGVSVGAVTSAAPVYISETAHPSARGSLGCVVQLGVNLGIFVAAFLGTYMSWRGLAIFGAASTLLYFVACLFIPDSPVWLVRRGKEDQARAALRTLRGPEYCVEYELQQIITDNSQIERSVPWRVVFTSRLLLVPLGIVGVVAVINRWSGYNALITYCATFLHQAVPSVSPYWAANAVTLMQVLSTIVAALTADRLGRRPMLLMSILAMATALFVVTGTQASIESGGSWVSVLATVCYVSAYSVGVGPLTWVLVGEMFPLAAREKAAALIAMLNWFCAFIVTKTYFQMQTTLGLGGVCGFYGAVCVIGFVLVYMVVPETQGRTLSEIEAYFAYAHKPRWRPHLRPPKQDIDLGSILGREETSAESYSTFSS